MEAPIRWNHPRAGLVGPDAFIPLAEETELVIPIGRWVLHQACLEAKNWPDYVSTTVNVFSVQFGDPDLFGDITSALKASGIPPQRLELDITETVIMEAVKSTTALLQELKSRGVNIAVDDLGTGLSSLQ